MWAHWKRWRKMTWQPIRSAPKDGTTILAVNAKSDLCRIVYWGGEDWRDEWSGDAAGPFTHWMLPPQVPQALVGQNDAGETLD